MSAFHDNALMGASGSQGYTISRSVRLRSSASAYFSRSLSTANTTTWTVSFWFKSGLLSSSVAFPNFFEYVETTGAGRQGGISPSDAGSTYQFSFYKYAPSTYTMRKIPAMVFRDSSAWYHAVIVWNTTVATAEDRAQIWINGTRVTNWTTNTNPAQNETWLWSIFTNSFIGAQNRNNGGSIINPWDGYLTEINFIDGQALTPSSFGETDTVTGVWKPKKYAGTYGTNGFYLNFSDNSSNTAATIGKDYSGNGNNWTPNNISVTSGVTYDSMLDVPTPYADGGNGRGNYAVLNPLDRNGTYGSVSDGNLTQAVSTANHAVVFSSMAMPTGKTYLEVTSGTTTSSTPLLIAFGLATQSAARTGYGNTNTWSIKCIDVKTLWNGGSSSSNFGSAFTSGTTMRLAYDSATGYLWIGDGSNWYNSTGGTTGDPAAGTNPSFTISTTEALFYFIDNYAGSGTVTSYTNFGQRPFSYTPPSGFKALNTFNLPEPTIKRGNDYFDVLTRSGTGASVAISSYRFAPDFVWIKARTNAYYHKLLDKVRGANKVLSSNATDAESTETQGLMSFDANGYTLGSSSDSTVNNSGSGQTYVDWAWKESATAGFDIVTYTGNGTAGRTVSHSLGVTPNLIIIKDRTSAVNNWSVNGNFGGLIYGTNYLQLNLTNALVANTAQVTSASSSTFTLGNGANSNANGDNYVAYCFAEVAGYSKFGSYTGNGLSDGPFVFLGFRPRYLMLKITTTSGYYWMIKDSSRDTYNTTSHELYANVSDAEYTASSYQLDFLSNGFKIRNSGQAYNGSGDTYIYAAFAENPLKFSLAR